MGFTHVVVSTFADRDALERYLRHLAHAPVTELLKKLDEQWISIDFES